MWLKWKTFEDRLETSVGLQGKGEPRASAESGREGHTPPEAAVPEHFVDVLHLDIAAIVDVIANIRGKRSSSERGVCLGGGQQVRKGARKLSLLGTKVLVNRELALWLGSDYWNESEKIRS